MSSNAHTQTQIVTWGEMSRAPFDEASRWAHALPCRSHLCLKISRGGPCKEPRHDWIPFRIVLQVVCDLLILLCHSKVRQHTLHIIYGSGHRKMYNWGWTGTNNKTHNYFKQLYYSWRPTYSLHVAPNYTDLFLAVQFLEIVKGVKESRSQGVNSVYLQHNQYM